MDFGGEDAAQQRMGSSARFPCIHGTGAHVGSVRPWAAVIVSSGEVVRLSELLRSFAR